MHRLARLSDRLNTAVIALCAGLIAIMFAISLTGIFFQFVLGSPLTWTYSLARLFLPWVAMLSITVAFKRGEHVAMAILLRQLPDRARQGVLWVNLALTGLFAAALVWFGYVFFVESTQLFMVSDFLQVPHRWVVASVPVSGLVLCLHMAAGPALVAPHELVEDEPV